MIYVAIAYDLHIMALMLLLLQNGDIPLHRASLKGDTKAVKILARSGANINIKNNVSSHN